MLLRTPSGAIVDASPEAASVYIRCGFTPVDEPEPQKTAPKKRASRSRKAAPKD